jgi:hypothetical protein
LGTVGDILSITIPVFAVSFPVFVKVPTHDSTFAFTVYVPPGAAGIFAWDFGVIRILYWVRLVFAVKPVKVTDVVAFVGLAEDP